MAEFSFRAVFLGSLLAVILGAANVYFGLYAGMTVSASIPAAVISMAILRGFFKKGTILENNMVQTIASSGEALAAGVIFTIPALLLTQAWHQFEYWPTTLIALTGGLLGVFFMIPLRRALVIEEEELKFPEGVACAEILKAGHEGGEGGKAIFMAVLLGGIYKFLSGGLNLVRSSAEWAASGAKSIFYVGTDFSLALFSVGFIVGPNVGTLIFSGGALAWGLAIPLYSMIYGAPSADPMEAAWTLWSTQIRFIGVGAMALGGLSTLFNCRAGIEKGIQKIFAPARGPKNGEIRTEQDLRRSFLFPAILLTTVGVFFLYQYLTQNVGLSILSSLVMVVSCFFFVAVAAYIVGLVGSSNSPLSGLTICVLLFTAALLFLFGFKGTLGVIAVLGVAGVGCCAICSANDICQDLKTGYLVGATPRKQQIGEIIGTIVPAFFFAPILTILQTAYGIGTPVREGVKALSAPQAMLFSKLAEAFFLDKGEIPWNMVWIGIIFAAIVIFLDEMAKRKKAPFRLYVMAVAIGIYLPLLVTAPIFLGGLAHAWISRRSKKLGETKQKQILQYGILIASGLIAGEALMGVGIAGLIFNGLVVPVQTGFAPLSQWATLIFYAGVVWFLMRWMQSGFKKI